MIDRSHALLSTAVPSVSSRCIVQELGLLSHSRRCPVLRSQTAASSCSRASQAPDSSVGCSVSLLLTAAFRCRRSVYCQTRRRPRCVQSFAQSSTSAPDPQPQPFGPGTVRELPIFPLNLVAFPTATVPLNIFEARYRVLFSTLLAGSPGIDEDLVSDQKPWLGSRLFGMCMVNREGGMATVGTTLTITDFSNLDDGRIFVVTKGLEKFRVLRIIEERPVMVAQVEMLEDPDEHSPHLEAEAKECVQLFKTLIELNILMDRIKSGSATPDSELDGMSPRELSYWLALIFAQSPMLQQALLEEQSVKKRLAQEKEVLEGTVRFLRARVALQSAFSSPSPDSSSSGDQQSPDEPQQSPPGGPD